MREAGELLRISEDKLQLETAPLLICECLFRLQKDGILGVRTSSSG